MILDRVLDVFRGQAVTIPPMDGALKPNTALEEAEVVFTSKAPDNLVEVSGEILFSSGNQVISLRDGKAVAEFGQPVTAIAAAEDGTLAAALESGGIEIRGTRNSTLSGFNCPTALAFYRGGDLYVCDGSQHCRPSEWQSDLMRGGATGSVWRVNVATGDRACLASGLTFPFGIAADSASDRLIVSEAWRHRLIAIPLDGRSPAPVLSKLPGYPSRISPAGNGGYVLALFAPRNRLIEFVLLEDSYRSDMMREIDSRYWIAPSLSSARSFLEPLQNGGVRTMGIHKPWSPSRSYGLAVELDQNLQPQSSYHSRANGTRHGVTSAIVHEGAILVAAKGGDCVLRIDARMRGH